MKDISHENDANNIEHSEHKQEKRKPRSAEKKSRGRREEDHIPLVHETVPHLTQGAMRLRNKRNIKNAEGDDPSKKKILW